MNKVLRVTLPLLLLLVTSGCSLQKMAVRSTGGILDAGFRSLMAEEDLPLARTAIESDLKLLEALILSDPNNEKLLLLAAKGFTSYALAFVEDEDPARASRLYLRGRNYAAEWIEKRYHVNLPAMERLDRFEEAVEMLPSSAVPGVFWMGNSWASAMMLNLDDVASLAALPKAETLMRFVLLHDEGYYYAGAHLFFAGYYGGRPRMLGGDPEKAAMHINRQIELSGGQFLFGLLFRVKYVEIPAMDEAAARETLRTILDFDLDRAPEIRLPNRVAQEKARKLLEHLDDMM